MSQIEFTNIKIDDFLTSRHDLKRAYIHILTHIHTDHLKGLYDGWNFGPIYCTRITAQLLIDRFPSLTCINVLELQTPTAFKMSETLEVTVTFFQANHCMGAVMVLLEGYMGTVLYTGDIRFNRQIFAKNTRLYPLQKRNAEFDNCSIHVDVLYLDNTFLKPRYSFPPRQQAIKLVIDFIDQQLRLNEHTRIILGLDTYGKEEVLEAVAHHYDTYILVDERRYETLKSTDYDIELFTTNIDEGFFQVVDKRKLFDALKKDPHAIGLILSGWSNHPTFRHQNRIYCIPYSLHSNYNQIHDFVRSIRPTTIHGIVPRLPGDDSIFYADRSNVNISINESNYSNQLVKFKQSIVDDQDFNYYTQLEQLRNKYCSRPSKEYYQLMNDIEIQKDIIKRLEPPKPLQFNSMDRSMLPIHLQTVERKRYKLQNQRNQQEINRVRNQILSKMKTIKGERIQVIEDDNADISMKNNSTSSPAVVDLEEGIIEEPEVIEIDPFNLPPKITNGSSKSKPIPVPSNPAPFSKQFQACFIERIRRKIKQKSELPSVQKKDNQRQKVEKSRVSKQKQRQWPILKKYNKTDPQSSSKKPTIANVNLDKLKEMRLLTTKEEVYNFFSRNQQLIKKWLK